MICIRFDDRCDLIPFYVTPRLYPGGELHPELPANIWRLVQLADVVTVDARLRDPKDILLLLLTVSAIRHASPHTKIKLLIPYIPYGRQDRVDLVGDPHSIKVMAGLINSLGAEEVVTYDPHSDVTSALVDQLSIIPQHTVLAKIAAQLNLDFSDAWVLAPDAGAFKKAFKACKALNARGMIIGDKTRDVATGAITGTRIHGEVLGRKVLVVDDICDGGRTFIELGKALQANGALQADLYVTHGLFSKGPSELSKYYQNVYTSDSYYGEYLPFHAQNFHWLNLTANIITQ